MTLNDFSGSPKVIEIKRVSQNMVSYRWSVVTIALNGYEKLVRFCGNRLNGTHDRNNDRPTAPMLNAFLCLAIARNA